MAQSPETGHAKNVANFENLISICTGYGTSYNPSKAAIKLTALSTLFTGAKNALSAINTAFPPYTNAIDAREIVFDPLSKLITRVINALDSSDVPKQTVAAAKTIARKNPGKESQQKLPLVVANPAAPAIESPKSISASQMGFDNRIENFDKLIQLLSLQTGLVDISGEVKKYVKSVFGGTSPQYKQVSGLKFTKVKS